MSISQNVVDGQVLSPSPLTPAGGLTFIEQLHNCSQGKCTKDLRPFLIAVNEENREALLTRPNCKMWNCEACAARNAKLWIARIINGCNKLGGEWFFLTLTTNGENRKEASIESLRDGWRRIYLCINALFSRNGNTPHFARVWEQHTDGSFHMHALIDIIMSKRWIKDTAFAAGLGHQADWRKVDNAGQVAGYIAKYTLKNATIARGGIEWPKGLRRIETSLNWPKLPEMKASEQWSWIIKMSREAQLASAQNYFMRGFDITDHAAKSEEE